VAEILIVEDDHTLGVTLEMSLRASGHEIVLCRTLEAARLAVSNAPPDLVLLDLGLPDGEGLDLLREMREAGSLTPILVLTAREMLRDRVEGLELGADDYITKPFELPELHARIDAFLRRLRWHGAGGKVEVGLLCVDFDRHECEVGGEPVNLTDLELRLLRYLVEREGKAVPREELITQVWGLPASTQTRSVDTFISRLRRFVEEDPSHPQCLLNIRGVGYRLVRPHRESTP
jgi:DNA-binding response OmpR family regulator